MKQQTTTKSALKVGVTVFCACCVFVVSAIADTVVTFEQISSPLGLCGKEDVLTTGVSVSTITAPSPTQGYRFMNWTVNGIEKRDVTGRSINPSQPFLLLEETTAVAHYLPATQDADTNSVPDWWEFEFFGALVSNAWSDVDGDGFDLTEEYRRDYHPSITNEIRDGGFCLVLSPASRVIANTNFVTYLEWSDPEGVITTSDRVIEKGTQVDVPALYGASGGYSFTHWDLNGIRQEDVAGRAVSFFSFVVESNSISTANYLPTAQDADGDGVLDWYELNMCGTTNLNAASDSDGDGFDLAEEYRRDYHPTVTNEIRDGGFSLVLSPASRVIVDENLSTYIRQSDPLGLLATTDQVLSNGTPITVSDVYGANSGYSFAYWTLNGEPQLDVAGRALSAFDFTLQSNTTAVAHYVPTAQDEDGDGIYDWYELNMVGTTNLNASSDVDGDGFDLAEEYRRDYHPSVTNEIRDGGFSLVLSPASRVIANTNFVTYLEWSDPEGVITTSDRVIEKGTQINVPALYGASGGYSFTHWDFNGVRQEDVTGRAVSFFSFVAASNSVSTANYVLTALDADSDGINDWLELNYFGTTNMIPASDADGDGFDLAEELRRDYHPAITNEICDGGFSLVLSPPVTVNLQLFRRIPNALVGGRFQPFFSADTSVTGVFSSVANSHPALGDWDGDGDLDLFVGGSNGVMRIFENAGSPVIMNWVERTSEFAALAGCWTNFLNPAPSLSDWNHDGLADLAVGGDTNRVWLVESPGSWEGDNLTVELQTSFVVAPSGAIPAFADINADGWADLLVLTEAGLVQCYTNTHVVACPYAAPPFTTDLLGTPVPDARGISAADVNGDGMTDVLISDENGNVWEFHGNGL